MGQAYLHEVRYTATQLLVQLHWLSVRYTADRLILFSLSTAALVGRTAMVFGCLDRLVGNGPRRTA